MARWSPAAVGAEGWRYCQRRQAEARRTGGWWAQLTDTSAGRQFTGYAEIESQLDELYDEVMAAYDGDRRPSKTELSAWKKRLDDLMRHVRPLRHDGKLSRNDVEALNGTASKLQRMLELLREPSFAEATAGADAKQKSGDGRGKNEKKAK